MKFPNFSTVALASYLFTCCTAFGTFNGIRRTSNSNVAFQSNQIASRTDFIRSRINVSRQGASRNIQTSMASSDVIPISKGSYVALVTPMTNTGEVDIAALRGLLQWHVKSGTDGICILGTTGEASLLSMKEREAVLTACVEEVKGKASILVGTGTINPNSVKEQTLQAIDLGCDAALVVTPYYIKPPQRGLMKHFTSIADLGLPCVLYNVPGRTGVDLVPESIGLIADHENIVGVKEATGDVSRVQQIRKACEGKDENILLLSGDDSTEMDFVLGGGDGCISVTANVAPADMHQMMALCLEGKREEAEQINKRLQSLHNNLFVESNPIPAKWAVSRIGQIPNGFCRPPLDELDSVHHALLDESLRNAGLI